MSKVKLAILESASKILIEDVEYYWSISSQTGGMATVCNIPQHSCSFDVCNSTHFLGRVGCRSVLLG